MLCQIIDIIDYAKKKTILSLRGYANLILDRTKYVGEGIEGLNKNQSRLGMIDKADLGEFDSLFLAHETNMPQGVPF